MLPRYEVIFLRLQLHKTNLSYQLDYIVLYVQSFVSKCDACKLTLLTADSRRWSAAVTDPLGITDSMDRDTNPVRIRELELELAQTKLALVESQVQHQVSIAGHIAGEVVNARMRCVTIAT